MAQAGTVDLVESRTDRDRYIDRTDTLDKVKALTMLPGDTYITTEMVAGYYEVGIEAIKAAVFDHRDEVESDGHVVLVGEELSCFKQLSGIRSRTGSLAVFPRRAILRLGMLLRDSPVAVAVRDHLLDVEEESAGPNAMALDINDPQMVLLLAQAAQRSAQQVIEERARRHAVESQLAIAAPKVAYVDQFVDAAKDGTTVGMYASQIGMTEPVLREYLLDRRVLSRRTVVDYVNSKGKRRIEYEWRARAGYLTWFKVEDQPRAPRMHNGQLRTTLYVTPVGKQGISDLLAKHPIEVSA